MNYDSYQALIFDMDGTLVDSGQLHESAWAATFERFELPLDRPYMRSLAGVPTRQTLEMVMERFNCLPAASLTQMNDFKEVWVEQHMHKFVQPTALEQVVRDYHGKRPMAVGTGAYTDEARRILTLCGLAQYMDVIVGSDQVKHPKPAPDIFLHCAEHLGASPAACVVFEDARLGIEAATRAGMAVVDVTRVLNIHNNYFL